MWREWLRSIFTSFWFIPAMFTALAVLAALLLVHLDTTFDGQALPILFPGGPDGARAVLGAITSSMISFTALVFSITVVVLQLTSSQFSPRILRTFLRDRVSQVSLGVFVATFVYAMTVLRSVRGETTDDVFVPRVATTVSFVLVVTSVAVFIWYIQHIANAIRAANVLEAVGSETRNLIDVRYPHDAAYVEPPAGTNFVATVRANRPGVVTGVDVARLVRLAREHDCLLELVPHIGGFLPEDAPVFVVRSAGETQSVDDVLHRKVLRGGVTFAVERTMEQDVAYGFRQLSDVAERVLSPSTNDHTTAIQAIDQLHDLLRRLATRPLPDRVHCDEDGHVRLVVREVGFAHYVDIAVEQVATWSQNSPRVLARLADLVDDTLTVVRPEHRRALEEQRARLARQRTPTS